MAEASPRRVLIRADADPVRGGGHVARCLALAGALRAAGAEVAFHTNPGAAATVPALAAEAVFEDGADSAAAISADILIVDHYDLSWRAERALAARTGARLTVAIDDLADRAHDCGVLVDAARPAADYRGLVPSGAAVLTGPAHALLRPDFARLRAASLARRREPALRRVVVAFGLSDATPALAAALDALARALPGVAVEVIVGPAGAAGAAGLLRAHPNARLLVAPPDYAARLATADLAIGAAGGAALERCALGLPSLVLPIAENQAASAVALAGAGAAHVLPDAERADPAAGLAALLDGLARAPEALAALSAGAAAHCDGLGAARAAAAILRALDRPMPPADAAPLRLRPAEERDARMLWAWRNDPDTRAASRNGDVVPWEAHRAWFAARLAQVGAPLFVAETGGETGGETGREPAGTLRLDPRDGRTELSLTVAPLRRGQGFGRALLAAGLAVANDLAVPPVIATVHADNGPSRRLFEASGFHTDGAGPWLVYAHGAPDRGDPVGN